IDRKRLAEAHSKSARWVSALLDSPRRTLLTILIGNMTVNTLAAAIVTLTAMHRLSPEGVSLVMVLFTALLILTGEITPKILAVRNHERLARLTAFPMVAMAWLLAPVRFLFTVVTDRSLLFLGRGKKAPSEALTEEELKTLVKIGEEDGILDARERQMIQKLFELGERPVKDIMIPRIDVLALDADDAPEKHAEILRKRHFHYIPVYRGSMDEILGVVSVQEYLLNLGEKKLEALLKEPLYIPETKRIDEVLEEFKRRDVSFAVCIDEHGGTDGIVTQEDILEEIFGEYYDEYETPVNPIRRLAHDVFLAEAKISLSDFNAFFSSDLKSEEASTLSGYILEHLGELPSKGKVLSSGGFEMTIDHVIRHRIHLVSVRRTP
ncbi:MAG: hemolysin family protein, partial [Candidatus Omnitrophota bacterium]